MTRKETSKTDAPALRLAAATALVVASACAAPMLATDGAGGETPAETPVRCGVATESHFGVTTFRPWVQLAEAAPGAYRFAVSGPGTALDQQGGFEAPARDNTFLGEAVLSGPASGYDVSLTITVDGTAYACRADIDDI